MEILGLTEIRRRLVFADVISRMREALIAQSSGECDTPMPMHLYVSPVRGEVHIKSSYRNGGRYFAVKIASTFPANTTAGLPTGNGAMLLMSAQTGEPVAFLDDAGHLTDVRTAAAAAMVARELGRRDRILGIVGTGIQARLAARFHAEVLSLDVVWIWGRSKERALECKRDIERLLPNVEVRIAASAAELAGQCRLIVTATASRSPLLYAEDIRSGTHLSCIGADSPGKQELDAAILRSAELLLVDSRPQCEKLGELQHALSEASRTVEIGSYCQSERRGETDISVCDFTGLGIEDLYIAEYCYERSAN